MKKKHTTLSIICKHTIDSLKLVHEPNEPNNLTITNLINNLTIIKKNNLTIVK
jgi:hypothetical protein